MRVKYMHKVGFTLLEILVSIGIIIILAGLLMPVFSRARTEALHSYDLNTLRQIGVANALYLEEHGRSSLGCAHLAELGRIPKDLCKARADIWAEGWANYIMHPANRVPGVADARSSFPLSFLGFREFSFMDDERIGYLRRHCTNLGFLVDFTVNEYVSPLRFTHSPTSGRYRRLGEDASVVEKTIIGLLEKEPEPGFEPTYIINRIQHFGDCPDEALWPGYDR